MCHRRAVQMARLRDHPLQARSRLSVGSAVGQSFFNVLQLLFILSALINDGWSARYCDKPLALWLEIHACGLLYDLIPVWAAFVISTEQLTRLNQRLNSFICCSAVFRLVWIIWGAVWVFSDCADNGGQGEQVYMVAKVIIIACLCFLGLFVGCCCLIPIIMFSYVVRNPEAFIEQMANENPGPPGAEVAVIETLVEGRHLLEGRKHRLIVPSLGWSRDIDEADAKDIIMMMDYEHDEEVAVLGCGHHFAVDGLKTWLKSNGSCPTCRSTSLLLTPGA